MVGRRQDLQKVVDICVREGEQWGLYFSAGKSLVWSEKFEANDVNPLQRGVKRLLSAGTVLLGAPIGSSQFEGEVLEARVTKVEGLLGKLPMLEDPHGEFTLLRSCFSLPKLSFALRTVDPTQHLLILERFDMGIRKSLEAILGTPLAYAQYQQSTLPVSMGGMGLRRATQHSSASYLASLGFSANTILEARKQQVSQPDLDQVVANLNQHTQDTYTADEAMASKQRVLSHSVDLHSQASLMGMANSDRDMARLHAVCQPGSRDWLNVVPSISLGLHLSSQEFVLAARYRLQMGCKVFPTAGACPVNSCTKEMDQLGDHALACAASQERLARHDRLRDSLYNIASQAGLGPRKEERDLLSGSARRPGDIYLPHWSKGLDAALDVTVVTPVQGTLTARAAGAPGVAVEQAHRDKLAKSYEECKAVGVEFIPLAVETWGGWHNKGLETIKTLSRQLARQIGRDEGETQRHTLQQLAILLLLHRGNVALLTSRVPEHPSPEVDGDVDDDGYTPSQR